MALGTKKANDCLRTTASEMRLVVVGGGCGPTAIEVRNECGEALRLSVLEGIPAFQLANERRRSLLGPEGSWDVEVEYASTAPPLEREGELVIEAGNGDRIRQRLRGELVWMEESLEATPIETLDLLFVLDVDQSLADFQDELGQLAGFTSFVMEDDWAMDTRVHVTTTSMEADGECAGEAGRLVPLDGLFLHLPDPFCLDVDPLARYLSLAPIAHVESICRLFASVSHNFGAIPFEAGRMWKPEHLDGNRVVDGSDGAEVRLDGSPERFWWFISGRKLVLPTTFNERHVNRGSRIWAAATPDRGTSAVVRPTAAMCAKSRWKKERRSGADGPSTEG